MEMIKNKHLNIISFIFIFSITALLVAYIAEYIFDLKPCTLCVYERIPYMASAVIALIGMLSKHKKIFMLMLSIIFLASTILAFYHMGVEWNIFEGTASCHTSKKVAQTIDELRAQFYQLDEPSCNKPAFEFLGISFAGWNFLTSCGLAIFCYQTWRKKIA